MRSSHASMTFRMILAAGGLTIAASAFGQPVSPPGDAAVAEIQRQVGTDPAVPAVPAQDRASEAADAGDVDWLGARGYLVQAQQAVRDRNLGIANELLERAEARILTRSTLAVDADQPMRSVRLKHVTAARAAVLQRDMAEALHQIDQALANG